MVAWCRQATSRYLNQCWSRTLPPYGVTRPQWVKLIYYLINCSFWTWHNEVLCSGSWSGSKIKWRFSSKRHILWTRMSTPIQIQNLLSGLTIFGTKVSEHISFPLTNLRTADPETQLKAEVPERFWNYLDPGDGRNIFLYPCFVVVFHSNNRPFCLLPRLGFGGLSCGYQPTAKPLI